MGGDVHDLQKEEDERREKVLPPSVRWTSPPNTTMKSWDENRELESSDLGETRRWAFPCNRDIIHPSSFIIHPCSLAGLVVELDGNVHDLQKEEDERREKVLSVLGLRVVRFRNDEVVRDLSAVVGKIKEALFF